MSSSLAILSLLTNTRVRSALSSGLPADAVSTGQDYSADVFRRKALIGGGAIGAALLLKYIL